MAPTFADRQTAGRMLARALQGYAERHPIVLGMARGGVVLAAAIARELNAEFDVLVVRKVGAPFNPEYGVGAVAPAGVAVFDERAMQTLRLTAEDLQPIVDREISEVERRLEAYRGGEAAPDVRGRTVILVDDGLATGISAVAAARYVKKLGADYTVFAAPVCSRPGASLLQREVDEVVCLEAPEHFYAVGMWYGDFSQVEDHEVIEILERGSGGGYLQ